MKKISTILLLLLLYACRKEEPVEEEPVFAYNGFGQIIDNDKDLYFKSILSPSYGKINLYYLGFEYLIGENVLRKQFSLFFLKPTLDRQVIYPFDRLVTDNLQATYSTRIGDGDIMGSSYDLNDTDDIEDYIQLIKFDTLTGEVSGRFQASFKLDITTFVAPSSPDSVILKEGYFEANFKK
jgi:hypothetical protein